MLVCVGVCVCARPLGASWQTQCTSLHTLSPFWILNKRVFVSFSSRSRRKGFLCCDIFDSCMEISISVIRQRRSNRIFHRRWQENSNQFLLLALSSLSVISNRTHISFGSFFFFFFFIIVHFVQVVWHSHGPNRERERREGRMKMEINLFRTHIDWICDWIILYVFSLAECVAAASCIGTYSFVSRIIVLCFRNRNASHWWHNHLLKYVFECLRRYEKWTPKRFRNSESRQLIFGLHTEPGLQRKTPWRRQQSAAAPTKNVRDTSWPGN